MKEPMRAGFDFIHVLTCVSLNPELLKHLYLRLFLKKVEKSSLWPWKVWVLSWTWKSGCCFSAVLCWTSTNNLRSFFHRESSFCGFPCKWKIETHRKVSATVKMAGTASLLQDSVKEDLVWGTYQSSSFELQMWLLKPVQCLWKKTVLVPCNYSKCGFQRALSMGFKQILKISAERQAWPYEGGREESKEARRISWAS